MTELDKFSVCKLNNSNYHLWKYKLELLLIKEGLWEVVSEQRPDLVILEWKKKDDETRPLICLSVEDDQLNYIIKSSSAKELETI